MKPFKINVSGYNATDQNFENVAKEIIKKHGICPALNIVVMAAVANDETVEHSKQGLKKGIDKYIRLIGFEPSYYNRRMSTVFNPRM